jgi:hypothetical protein
VEVTCFELLSIGIREISLPTGASTANTHV